MMIILKVSGSHCHFTPKSVHSRSKSCFAYFLKEESFKLDSGKAVGWEVRDGDLEILRRA